MTTRARHLDPSLSIDDRVADLLSRMTLTEKIAQLGSVWGFQILPGGHVDRSRLERLLANGLGEITRIAGATNLTLIDAARAANDIQRFLAVSCSASEAERRLT